MSGMPYFLTKGPFFSNIEASVLAMSQADLVDWRQFLLDGHPIPEMAPANDFEAKVSGAKDHLYKDWLGWTLDESGTWQKPTELPEQVGWWAGWRGDPDLIIRGTLIEAIEASLGWDSDGTPPGPSHAPWPIDFVWSCPHPWMEGWVTWAPADPENTGGPGRVRVTLATPGNGEGVTTNDSGLSADGVLPPVPLSGGTGIPGFVATELPASKADKGWGMTVTRARVHKRTGVKKTAPTPFGQLVVSLGDGMLDVPAEGIWVHAPAYEAGGVLPDHV